MNRLAQHVTRQLERHIAERRVVVWYDPRSEWERAFPDFTQEKRALSDIPAGKLATLTFGVASAQFACFEGSVLALRVLSEQVAAGDAPQPLVLYLPDQAPDEENSILMELELAGKRWVPQLRRLARDVLKPFYVDGKVDELLDMAKLGYGDVVEWLEQAEEQAAGQGSMLKLVFPGFESSERLLAEWLVSDARDTAMIEKNAVPELCAHWEHRLGLKLSGSPSLADVRNQCWRYLLASEFRSDLLGPAPSSLSMLPMPTTDPQLKAVRQVLSTIRREHAADFVAAADKVEQELQIRQAGLPASEIGTVDTFRFEEQTLLAWSDRLLVDGRYEEVMAICGTRGNSFWVDQSLSRKLQWSICRQLAELGAHIQRTEKQVVAFVGKPSQWVAAYAATEGWWEADQIHRQLDTLIAKLEDEPELSASLAKIRDKYEVMLQRMAVGFTTAIRQAGWQMDGVTPQTSVYAQNVGSVGGPTAYFLVDAMRFEMGRELASQLEGAAAVQVTSVAAALPTITKIGMAALLPGASGSFTVAEEKGKLGARVDGSFLPDWSSRKKYWKARVPDMVEVELGEVLGLTPRRLQTKVANVPLILVRSGEIDELGESGQSHVARQVMATIIGNLVRAIRKLSTAGVTRFVVTADHGFQFLDDKGDEMKTESPGGETVELHRRCWVGRGGQNPPGTVRVTGAELGYDDSLEFVFPVGLGVFKAGGSLAYHHGGLSLQEMVVPVVTVRVEKVAGDQTPVRRVRIAGAPSILTTRTLGVKIALEGGDLFETGAPIEVRPVLVAANREVGKAGMAVGADVDLKTHCLRLAPGQEILVGLLLELEDVPTVKVAVLDPNTGVVLGETEEIAVKLGM
ncbi:MAG: PglZ domain-containing protein [Bradyrhizobium sp.]|nr:PglZ domain-containing protein [Bradyrhizobium sp.]